jgi:hypothetical protein
MGNPRGVKRNFDALEQRRFQAVKLFSEQLNNSEIGRLRIPAKEIGYSDLMPIIIELSEAGGLMLND